MLLVMKPQQRGIIKSKQGKKRSAEADDDEELQPFVSRKLNGRSSELPCFVRQ